jgi:hypothetical protein
MEKVVLPWNPEPDYRGLPYNTTPEYAAVTATATAVGCVFWRYGVQRCVPLSIDGSSHPMLQHLLPLVPEAALLTGALPLPDSLPAALGWNVSELPGDSEEAAHPKPLPRCSEADHLSGELMDNATVDTTTNLALPKRCRLPYRLPIPRVHECLTRSRGIVIRGDSSFRQLFFRLVAILRAEPQQTDHFYHVRHRCALPKNGW